MEQGRSRRVRASPEEHGPSHRLFAASFPLPRLEQGPQDSCLAWLINAATTGDTASPPGEGGTWGQGPAEGLRGVTEAPQEQRVHGEQHRALCFPLFPSAHSRAEGINRG